MNNCKSVSLYSTLKWLWCGLLAIEPNVVADEDVAAPGSKERRHDVGTCAYLAKYSSGDSHAPSRQRNQGAVLGDGSVVEGKQLLHDLELEVLGILGVRRSEAAVELWLAGLTDAI